MIYKKLSPDSQQPMRDDLHKTNAYDTDPLASHQPIRWLYLSLTDPEPILWPILILHFLMHSFLISQTTCPYLELIVVYASNYLNYPERLHILWIFSIYPLSLSFQALILSFIYSVENPICSSVYEWSFSGYISFVVSLRDMDIRNKRGTIVTERHGLNISLFPLCQYKWRHALALQA